ncbi:WD domain- G-beta repeat containing protein [Apiospora aurea]|uniref:WD domain- G-beta repeat containing protein n=1 Tax=Apiospora aurea TaxID=335848 RepID=A0ABR1QS82_9PEZI
MVHAFEEPVVDFIFVHGLGGTSVSTWSWDRDPANFWIPWLSNESDLSRSRVFTYGYDAKLTGPYTTVNILDFAKDLLFRMKTYSGQSTTDKIPIGTLPIIFVVHSMGGLVVKKAYILGKTDSQYTDMITRICAIVFLATPHKGSQLAQTLNNILKAAPGGGSKAFVADLEKNSGALQDINEHFRHICGDLELVSFYETMKTSIGGGIKRLIVERDSALLEYPGETSSSLMAAHHGMSKFKDPFDSNFTNVTNVLRFLTRPLMAEKQKHKDYFSQQPLLQIPSEEHVRSSTPDIDQESYLNRLGVILGIKKDHDDEFSLFSEKLHKGSCQWLLQRANFQSWATNSRKASRYLWISGSPGSGKSTLSSFIIKHLQNQSYAGTCQRHFFLAGDEVKKTLAYMLRSIAYQVAVSSELFLSRLVELSDASGVQFDQEKVLTIWERVFEGLLFRLPLEDPLFWVIDGLDEAESPIGLLKLVSKIRSATNINVLIVSRATKEISKDVGDLLPTVVHEKIATGDTADDIRSYARTVVSRIPISDGNNAREDVVQQIVAKASGSFLWVKLALDRLKGDWYTEEDIRSALNELPAGMETLYRRMMQNVSDQPEKTRDMAMRILTWASCACSPLDVAELEVALCPGFTGFVNLGLMAEEICGHFVAIKKGRVTLIHETALKFLLHNSALGTAPISEHDGHAHAATVCMTFLSDTVKWRRIFNSAQPSRQQKTNSDNPMFEQHPFLLYALSQWAYHASLASAESEELLGSVLEFLEEHCLLWMQGVALTGHLRTLVRSAQYLKTYAKRRSQRAAKGPPRSFAAAGEDELRQWANGLIRVVGRFGANMLENTARIANLIVPFGPRDSIIAKTFGLSSQGGPSVRGVSSNGWDDCLARLSLGDNRIATELLCKDHYLVTLLATGGTATVWHAETFEELRNIKHDEYVTSMAASRTSNLIATAGFKTTKVWDMISGKELNTLPKDRQHHTKALSFGGRDDDLWIAYDDCEIKCFDLETEELKSSFLAKDQTSQDFSCARWITFNRSNTQVAIVFRGRPVVVWDIQESLESYTPPRRCVLAEDRLRSASEGDAWNAPEVCLWHPTQTDHLLILYEDTKIVEWNVMDDEQMVHDHTAARAMTMSEDGSFLLTNNINNTISIWIAPGYTLMYRMRYDELVTDLTFSPDGARFYDLRGSFCNVWEPDALIRADNIDRNDMSSTFETITSEPVLATDDNSRVPVTSLVCDSSDKYYCVGKEDGSVTIHHIADGSKSRKVVNHSTSSSVRKVAWSASDKYLASVDYSGRVIIKRLEPPTPEKDKWAVFAVLDFRMDDDDVIRQVLFGNRDSNLLIASSSHICLFSLKKKEMCRKRLVSEGRTWLNHPKDHTLLICIDGHSQQQYFWKDLELVSGIPSDKPEQVSTPPIVRNARAVQQTVQVRDQWVLIELLEASDAAQVSPQRGSSREFELLNLQKLPGISSSSAANTRQTLHGLTPHVKQLVGCFQDRVVFLDHQYWLCTWGMELTYTKHKRHFFLPKDWVSPTSLQMLALNKKGVLLCPRNGEVAIVRSGFR